MSEIGFDVDELAESLGEEPVDRDTWGDIAERLHLSSSPFPVIQDDGSVDKSRCSVISVFAPFEGTDRDAELSEQRGCAFTLTFNPDEERWTVDRHSDDTDGGTWTNFARKYAAEAGFSLDSITMDKGDSEFVRDFDG